MLTRWQPFTQMRSEVDRLHDEMNRLFRRYDVGNGSLTRAASYPPLNVWEDEGNFYVEAELPGLAMENLEVHVNAGNQLSIKGERKAPTEEQGRWHRQERAYGSFARVLTLPSGIDTDQVSAALDGGVLTLTLPKREEAKPRRITVKAK